MRRREFIAGFSSAMAVGPVAARAQQIAKMKRVGILLYAKQERATIDPMLRGLEALGYVDGKTIAIEYRDAEGKSERLAEVANELVRLKPDLIFSFGGEQAPVVKKATATIPIVVVVSNDPVESGLVASLGRPGGNITGVTWVFDQLAGKSVELLKDTLPSLSRAAVLWNPDHTDPEFRETQRAARALNVQLHSLEVRQSGDFEGALQAVERERAEALIVFGSRLMFLNRQRIGEFAAKNRLVMVGVPTWLMEIGALLNYGPNVPELTRSAATYVDKVLKGARPADLPMQQPTKFELTVSLKKAKELGITVPPTVIARADRVIE
jgi:putative ABC transport system substrate-binding protein